MKKKLNMKRINTIIALIISIFGCNVVVIPYFLKGYTLNLSMEVTVGSIIMYWESGMKYNGKPISNLRKELLYGGISQNVIQINYREYSEGYARQPFYQDLKYDLSKSKTIAFQDIIIEIDTADQQKITFKIIREPEHLADKEKPISLLRKLGVIVDEYNCVVKEISKNSFAANSELKVGDKILRINGEKVYCDFNSNFDINDKIANLEGNEIFFLVSRNGNERDITIKR